jgi:hypothetical protein
MGWLAKKADKAADSFATAVGAAGAAAMIGGAAFASRHIPGHVENLVGAIVCHATEWLSHVTLPF